MTHSIEELKRQMDDAKSRLNEAEVAFKATRLRYEEALLADHIAQEAEKGIVVGAKVEAFKTKNDGEYSKGVYFVHSFCLGYFRTPETLLCKPKKDGTPTKRHTHVWFNRLEVIE